jgi:hypothetical protein
MGGKVGQLLNWSIDQKFVKFLVGQWIGQKFVKFLVGQWIG